MLELSEHFVKCRCLGQRRAARRLGWKGDRSRVSYVMTRVGAEPVQALSGAPLDYQHYLER